MKELNLKRGIKEQDELTRINQLLTDYENEELKRREELIRTNQFLNEYENDEDEFNKFNEAYPPESYEDPYGDPESDYEI